MSNRAAFITAAKVTPFEVRDIEIPSAGQNQVVIKNHAVAINPVDCKSVLLSLRETASLTCDREDSGIWYCSLERSE